ncbi:S-adenosyl-L-methionine-dependent methyltransferase, partial [Dentipellis sp. KUC8613]
YTPHPGDILEQQDTHIFGEDADAADADGNEDGIPVRVLTDFVLFDPSRTNELVSPALLESVDDVAGRQFEGAGAVAPYYVNEEDEGLEDDDEDEDGDGARDAAHGMRLRLSAVLAVYIDYSKLDDPIYITTLHAWYILRKPSPHYRDLYKEYYRVHKTLQWLISTALAAGQISYEDFMEEFGAFPDEIVGRRFDVRDINDALRFAIDTLADNLKGPDDTPDRRTFVSRLLSHPLISHVLGGTDLYPQAPSSSQGPPRSQPQPQRRRTLTRLQERLQGSTADRDLAVLRPEQQNPTHVTPLISVLAAGLFRERLVVVGPRPAQPSRAAARRRRDREGETIMRACAAAHSADRRASAVKQWQLARGSEFLTKLKVRDTVYEIGDVVIVPIGSDEAEDPDRPAPELPTDPEQVPPNALVADYFWFAKIMYFQDIGAEYGVHVQWFEHSSKTILGDISDPQELFLTNICGFIDPPMLVGKVKATMLEEHQTALPDNEDHYYYKFVYSKQSASFTSIPPSPASNLQPPSNCHSCLLLSQADANEQGYPIPKGVAYRGVNYHNDDFVFVKSSSDGPCHIAQITSIAIPKKASTNVPLKIRLLGLFTSLASILPPNQERDERHLFLTDETKTVQMQDLLRVCYVAHFDSIPSRDYWCSNNTDHFYLKYHFPTLSPARWDLRRAATSLQLPICETCFNDMQLKQAQWEMFAGGPPMRIFDPFAGVGAFGLGMEMAGGMKTTHAIEISPSAAITLKANMPDTVVYNQCANTVLQYTIKSQKGHLSRAETPTQLYDDVTKLGPPPSLDAVDIMIAGFPCQPHSGLNMFQKANDRKSNLILNLLSWVDIMRPNYCVFENVKGFLSFNLNSVQKDQYRTEGGITMGGLKFVYRALLAMNYQVHCALLQGAHYGTPQTRVRFFMIAAKRSYILPEFPAPTHDFPDANKLAIRFTSSKHPVRPISTERGIAPFQAVTVDSAISDLPRFHWKHPKPFSQAGLSHAVQVRRVSQAVQLECDQTKPWIGIQGVPQYHTPPLTTFQHFCRERPTPNIQHFTRTLKPTTSLTSHHRVLNIPLVAGADYRDLKKELWEWQFSDPNSAVARQGFRPGLYGRIDKDGYFQTTVTNMEPTAKQSKVLNPYCHRTVTVRELARSQGFPDHFVFHSENNKVLTMHRQIGNAVPLPLGIALGREIRKAQFQMWQNATLAD